MRLFASTLHGMERGSQGQLAGWRRNRQKEEISRKDTESQRKLGPRGLKYGARSGDRVIET